jgi:hypothetical protein
MAINLIAMLTHNDKTVEDAQSVFEANKNIKVKCWGFKDVGISEKSAISLVQAMKEAGKITFLEPLVESEEECLKAVQLAIDCQFDYVIGMIFYKSSYELLKNTPVKYFPTCGKRAGLPRMLYGTVDSIIGDAQRIAADGANGICLSAYRYVDGDSEDMARRFVKEVGLPFIITGGIKDDHRLDFVKETKPWGFTIGSALFGSGFGGNKTIAEKLDYILDYLKD